MSADALPQDDPGLPVTDAIRDEVRDANELLDFAIQSGLRKVDGAQLSAEIITAIKTTAAKVGLGQKEDSARIKASELARFALNYYALAEFTSLVTAGSLRDTRAKGDSYFHPSAAQYFTRLLWIIAGFFVLAVLSAGYIMQRPNPTDPPDYYTQLATLLTPWAYGGLGACAYLLRSAHAYIHERSFDALRKPEYLSRILLGAISGGAVIILISQLTDPGGTSINLSAAALGFIAGYSTDFLFNAVERIVTAILPKVSLESVQKASPAKAAVAGAEAGISLKELIERMDKAEGSIAKLRDRP